MSDPKPRIVMLVHNSVKGDSRVQKQARSIAGLGWDVTLVGTSPDRRTYEGTIGDAAVILIPLPVGIHQRPHEFRRGTFRDPLAYPPGPTANWKRQHLDARRADLGAAKAEAAITAEGRGLRWAALQARRVGFKLESKWTGLRLRRSEALQRERTRMSSPIDRFTTAFWKRAMGDRAWRRLDPDLWRYELAFGNTIDRLEPDLIHANDFAVLGVGARAALRARAAGRDVKLVWDAHEYLPGIRPWRDHPRWHPAQIAHEREYAPYADAVVTVSEALGELLRRDFALAEPPAVVLNAPSGARGPVAADGQLVVRSRKTGERLWAPEESDEPAAVPSLRGRCGIGPEVPLMVYSGGDSPQRGLDSMIRALRSLPGVHAAFVLPDGSRYAPGLRELALELGVDERVHFAPYVEYYQVAEHLAEADLGVIPIHHWPNHEIALITKFFEYSHARLPIAVSDVKAMSEAVLATGQGEVFRADDPADLARAVEAILADPERYRKAYEGPADLDAWTWERQAEILDGVYRRVLGR
ncbi:glycosyltransferase family 4 protein [Glycomyces sp. NPDC046736]|uniref:glycosyltransferase family 4 protein n=1 Tax=Glycomyces sp. NPDC046736 TaxID=3155615 RepID=UPI0033E0F0AF